MKIKTYKITYHYMQNNRIKLATEIVAAKTITDAIKEIPYYGVISTITRYDKE